jgi:hypothetical protein
MQDLDSQIRDYLDATSDPLTADDVLYQRIGDDTVRPIITRKQGPQSWSGRLVVALAAAAVVSALVAVPIMLRRGPVEPIGNTVTTAIASTTTPKELSREDALVAAAAAEIAEFHSTDFAIAIGTVVEPNCTYDIDRNQVRCHIVYSNHFYTAHGRPDLTIKWFTGTPTSIVVLDSDLPADTELNALVATYIESLDGWEQACADEPIFPESLACGTFYASHLDTWPTWYAENRDI